MSTVSIGLLPFLRRWWPLVAVVTAWGGFLAYTYASRVTPIYEARAQLIVEGPAGGGGAREAAELAPTYAELVRSTAVVESAILATKAPLTPDELRPNVRGESEKETRLVTIRARDSDPARAVSLANGLASGLIAFVSIAPSARPPKQTAKSRPHVGIVERAAHAVPVRPQSLLITEFGAIAGLFCALAVVLFAESRRRKIRDEEELAQLAQVAVLSSVNGASTSRRLARSLVVRTRYDASELESYHRLATRIAVANGDVVPRSLLVMGAQGTEGSGMVAAKLALALARDGRRVVLADFGEDGKIASFFEIASYKDPGPLVKRSIPVRHGGITLDRFPLRSATPLVLAVPRDPLPRSLGFAEAQALVALLTAEGDVFVVHGPAPGRSRQALTWARAVVASVLVVRSEHTKRDNVVTALESLEPVRRTIVGTVLAKGRV
jgi:capsular polysaccharide biosynthesis protein